VQINFTEKESQLQKIFLKSAIGFFYILKFDLFNKILYNKLNRNLKGGIFYDSN